MLREETFTGYMDPWAYDEPIDVFEGDHLVFDWSAETRARVYVSVVAISRDVVLLVDDYDHREDFPPQAGWGTDDMRDAFYDTLTSAVARPVVEWDVSGHAGEAPGVVDLASASTVIWYCDHVDPAIEEVFPEDRAFRYAALGGFVRAGGNLILSGQEVLARIAGQTTYPVAVAAGDTTPGRMFIRDQLGIGSADNSGCAANKNSPWNYGYCFYGAVPTMTSVPEGPRSEFVPVYIDSVGPGGFPEPGKWPLYTSSASNYTRCGVCGVEALEAYGGVTAGPVTIEAATIDAFLNYNYQDQTCITLKCSGDEGGNTCYFGFPLYYLQTDEMVEFFDALYELLGE